jgi:hypothetical protein
MSVSKLTRAQGLKQTITTCYLHLVFNFLLCLIVLVQTLDHQKKPFNLSDTYDPQKEKSRSFNIKVESERNQTIEISLDGDMDKETRSFSAQDS